MDKYPRTHKIIGEAMEVHSIIDPGHLEAVYHKCLEIEFENRKIPFVSKPQLAIYYKERKLKKYYIPDFILFKEIVLEIKAEGGNASIKKMGVFTFIKYLTQHISDKYFRVAHSYGLFSNRLKGKLLAKARILLKQPVQKEKCSLKNWRERILEYIGKDPLICENCSIEISL